MLVPSTPQAEKRVHIYADQETLEPEALAQFNSALGLPFVVQAALMPDAHTGYSLPIGGVVATRDYVVPSWVGYDIGCGVLAMPTTFKKEDIQDHEDAIFDDIYETVPVGFNHNRKELIVPHLEEMEKTEFTHDLFLSSGRKQLGSLGQGNHFIEIGYDKRDDVWIIVHSGSRGLGHDVAKHYMTIASGDGRASEGHHALSATSHSGIEYITDLKFCLEFALANRLEIARRVGKSVKRLGLEGDLDERWLINRNHNHAEQDAQGYWIHRKGATHAEQGMLGVIPGNMYEGSFIVVGKGNPDSLCSSSHGAGRVLSRKAAKQLDLEEFKTKMKGIKAKVDVTTLDECPRAYKDIHEVMAMQTDLVEVANHVKPLINIKG